MINILIVDDSITESQILKYLFESEKDFRVVGIAHDGKEAVEMAARLKPDIITMDLEMPVMDGHTATRLIMSQNPIPIVVISSKLNDSSMDMTFLALEAGAVSVIDKPNNVGSKNFQSDARQIIETIRSMSEIKVFKRRFKPSGSLLKDIPAPPTVIHQPGSFDIIAIGTSIGGPQVLKDLLSQLPPDFPVPIVIVQHMAKGFISGFTKWLDNNVSLKVKNADDNEVLKSGVVYLAPDNFHLTVVRVHGMLLSKLIQGKPIAGFCPSITVLMQSVAKASGKKSIGILLTGMGSDGSQGLLELKLAQGLTLVQDEKSCVVFGMADVAVSLGAVDKIVEIDKMADYLRKMTNAIPQRK